MLPPVRTLLVALAGVALLVPAIGAAAVRGSPPVTTPVETIPQPVDPAPPAEPEAPPETITIKVPPLPEPAAAAPKRKAARPRAQARRAVQPTRVDRVAQPQTRRRANVAPVAKEKPTPRAKPKPKKPKLKAKKPAKLPQPQRWVIAPTSAFQTPIRDRRPAHGVLGAQFSGPAAASPAAMQRTGLYLALVFAAVLGMLLCLVRAAPVLAVRWPEVFIPVIEARERIVLAGVCLAGAALTLAITWALTGPGA